MKRHRHRRPVGFAASAAVSEINITPMVDVLLCLLILVMVIQPGLLKGLDVQVPPVENATAAGSALPRDQIILQVRPGPAYAINSVEITPAQLEQRIREIFRDRGRKVLFVRGTEDTRYGEVVHAVDVARAAGIRVVGLVPREEGDKADSSPTAPE